MTSPSRTKYDSVAMALHWTIALMMVFMLFFGEELMETEEAGSTLLPSLHVSIGSAILILTLVRLAWRLIFPPPALPFTMGRWEQIASQGVHALFYLLLIGLPLTGWLAFREFLSEEPSMTGITIFGLLPVPTAPSLGLPAGDIHGVLVNIGIAILALHVIAALKHQFINRDDVLRRMLP